MTDAAPSRPPPAEVRKLAERWYASQLERLAKRHGAAWPELQEWVSDYLKGELRERLRQLGWRPGSGR